MSFAQYSISMTLNVFITGASSGIGEALAMTYAVRGARLGLVARRADLLQKLRSHIAETTASVAAVYVADVTDSTALGEAARAHIEQHGVPDVVIACAGVSIPIEPEREGDVAVFNKVLATNTLGTLSTFQPFISAMKMRGNGKLVGIASVAGIRGLPGASAYSASKAAVIAFCESLRIDLRGSGVEVLTICPGYVRTAMAAAVAHRQPFLIDAIDFATQAVDAIDGGASYSVIPRQMRWMARI
ncbi:MAG: SDR family oxidoreductase, partial [Alcaligenaceae bacterium]